MSDYISREKLKSAYLEAHKGSPGRAFTLICEASAEDVAPVVHGHWIDLWGNHGVEFIGWRCTACGHIECGGADGANYCPNCGAKMS